MPEPVLTANFDLLQTALLRTGSLPQPHRLEIQFLREISPDTVQVEVRLETRGAETAFVLGRGPAGFAQGLVA